MLIRKRSKVYTISDPDFAELESGWRDSDLMPGVCLPDSCRYDPCVLGHIKLLRHKFLFFLWPWVKYIHSVFTQVEQCLEDYMLMFAAVKENGFPRVGGIRASRLGIGTTPHRCKPSCFRSQNLGRCKEQHGSRKCSRVTDSSKSSDTNRVQ